MMQEKNPDETVCKLLNINGITRLLERARQTILWIQLKARHTP
jgi:hypothetical protein